MVFKGKVKNGFFIEAGSADAESNSDTLHFEVSFNHTMYFHQRF